MGNTNLQILGAKKDKDGNCKEADAETRDGKALITTAFSTAARFTSITTKFIKEIIQAFTCLRY